MVTHRRVRWAYGTYSAIDVYTYQDELLIEQVLSMYGIYLPKNEEQCIHAHRVLVYGKHHPQEVFRYLQEVFE